MYAYHWSRIQITSRHPRYPWPSEKSIVVIDQKCFRFGQEAPVSCFRQKVNNLNFGEYIIFSDILVWIHPFLPQIPKDIKHEWPEMLSPFFYVIRMQWIIGDSMIWIRIGYDQKAFLDRFRCNLFLEEQWEKLTMILVQPMSFKIASAAVLVRAAKDCCKHCAWFWPVWIGEELITSWSWSLWQDNEDRMICEVPWVSTSRTSERHGIFSHTHIHTQW